MFSLAFRVQGLRGLTFRGVSQSTKLEATNAAVLYFKYGVNKSSVKCTQGFRSLAVLSGSRYVEPEGCSLHNFRAYIGFRA